MELEKKEIDIYLGLYKNKYRLIGNCNYENGKLFAKLKPYCYTYTIDDLDYLTATQLNLYLSQLTYILIACAIKDPTIEELSENLYESYMQKMFDGRLFFVEISHKMKEMILKNSSDINAEIQIISIKRIENSIFAKLKYSISDNFSVGELLIGMKK